MKTKLLLGLALVLSLLLTGCETEHVCQSRFIITNLNGNGRTDTRTNVFAGPYGGLFDGKTMAAYWLGDSTNALVLLYPTNKLNQIVEWPVDSSQAQAWWVRTHRNDLAFQPPKNLSDPPFPHAEPLRGTIKVGNYDWRHKNRKYLAVDLTGTNHLVISGQINSHEKTRFDAKQLWLDPYLIIVGPFVKW